MSSREGRKTRKGRRGGEETSNDFGVQMVDRNNSGGSASFPDISCRAKAITIDEALGIQIDGVQAERLRAKMGERRRKWTGEDVLM
eukprot:485907-Hanusia_phi.AAC.1